MSAPPVDQRGNIGPREISTQRFSEYGFGATHDVYRESYELMRDRLNYDIYESCWRMQHSVVKVGFRIVLLPSPLTERTRARVGRNVLEIDEQRA